MTETECIVKLLPMPDQESTPRWVKVFGIVAVLAILAFAILHILGIAPHGH